MGTFDLRAIDNIVALAIGVLLLGVMSARVFGRFHGGNAPNQA